MGVLLQRGLAFDAGIEAVEHGDFGLAEGIGGGLLTFPVAGLDELQDHGRRPTPKRWPICASVISPDQLSHSSPIMPRPALPIDIFTEMHRAAQQHMRFLIWWFYRGLKACQVDPTSRRKAELRARFDRIFKRRTGFVSLDRLLARLHANKPELLLALDRPEIPLHTNGSERDIRCQVTKRKISGGTRSDPGRDCRDAFLGIAKTCSKLGIAFWDYLGDRLDAPKHPNAPYLPDIVKNRCQSA
jgi:hypothetical protein